MKRGIAALLCALLTLCAAGCAKKTAPTPAGETLDVYYAAAPDTVRGGDILTAVTVPWSEQAGQTAEAQAAEALALLLGQCEAEGFSSPIPAGTQLLSCRVNGRTAEVDFSQTYGQLSGMALSVADYCVTLTLAQIDGINLVRILVDGKELSYRSSNVFFPSDALLSSTEDVVRTFAARLYFPDADGVLTGEDRVLTLYEGESRGPVILNALKGGPENPSLRTAVPEGFAVLSVRTENEICYLNLPGADETLLPEDEAEQQLLVQSIVRSLCSVSGVSEVQLLLDGERVPTFGSVDVSQPLRGTEE